MPEVLVEFDEPMSEEPVTTEPTPRESSRNT
jgi:hypothetical protein